MMNISFAYQELFTFRILHEYYKEEKTSDFILLPSIESSVIANRLGIIIKQIENKLFILIEKEKIELLSSSEFLTLKFSFFIYSTNIHFNNFTDLPINPSSNEILCFNTKHIEDRCLDSSIAHAGIYVTEKNYKNKMSITTLFPKESNSKKLIGIIEIYIADLISSTIQDYFIKFAARKTYWKYAFVSRYRKLEDHAEILSTDGILLSFARQDNEFLLNNQEATIFVSDAPIPLKQFNNQRLSLIMKNKIGKTIEIIPMLPLPSIEMVKPESRMKEAKVFSEVVVYL